MPDGCILGECPVCGDLIWECEWDITSDEKMVHEKCLLEAEFNKEKTDIVVDLQQRIKKKDEQIQGLLLVIRDIEQGANPKFYRDRVNSIINL
ncbi:hypothetical protein [Peribacillus muralis]|uniref:hypothetical protein n=1 Tax=Peribacillus muralis TaxID=264697 RepID=UPI003CFD8712